MQKIRSILRKFFSNKKRVILSAGILCFIAVGAVIAVSFLAPKTVTGSWELTVNPETNITADGSLKEADRVYYIFEKPDSSGKGNWSIYYDGGVEHYKYRLTKENGEKKINLGSDDLTYKIVGSKLFGTAKMTIIYPETDPETGETTEQEYILEQRKAPDYRKKTYADFETDDKLAGEWATNARSLEYYTYLLPYKETLSFGKDGILTIRYESEQLELDRYLYYAYTANGKELTFSPVLDRETKYTVQYGFDAEGNLNFLDDNTSDSVFADAFFDSVLYYPPERLPDPPELTEETESQPLE